MVARAGIKEAMGSKDTDREENIRDEKRERVWTMREERIELIEDTELDTGMVFDLKEGDGEIEIITESTKIGEGRGDKVGSGEEMKEREARIIGLLFLFLVFRLSLLIERLILRWSDRCCHRRA